MPTSWRVVTERLIEALRAVLPPGFEAQLDTSAGGIELAQTDMPGSRVIVGVRAIVEQPGDADRLLAVGCQAVLDAVQDLIAEATAEPWPGRSTELPLPQVDVREREIRLWYGQRDAPALTLGPVRR